MNKIEFGMSCIVAIYGPESCSEGCDASVRFVGRNTERASHMNARLHGFRVIDIAKHCLEKACLRTESCADFLAYASRNAVVLTGGKCWQVVAGRRDGRISNKIELEQNIPPPTAGVDELVSTFAQKGLNTQDMVDLSGIYVHSAACLEVMSGEKTKTPNSSDKCDVVTVEDGSYKT
uniref:Plant heme peroxidase family profile domain-containing protein n=1 Tax=Physcomitrium patens TaxID=3218 RepID=A0A2K1KMS0_PHYPA|nr:hypothetical protein PHYPA_005967 [Physcomitrium patens]